MPKIEIEKLHAGYRLIAYPHMTLLVTAQNLLDIMDYALQHTSELRQEVAQAEKEYRRWMHLPDPMQKCDLCGKDTSNVAEKRIGASFNPITQEQTPVEYSMPLYCDDCLHDLEALDADMSDLEAVRREWQAYRNEGLGERG